MSWGVTRMGDRDLGLLWWQQDGAVQRHAFFWLTLIIHHENLSILLLMQLSLSSVLGNPWCKLDLSHTLAADLPRCSCLPFIWSRPPASRALSWERQNRSKRNQVTAGGSIPRLFASSSFPWRSCWSCSFGFVVEPQQLLSDSASLPRGLGSGGSVVLFIIHFY